jgi:hypothetical protein
MTKADKLLGRMRNNPRDWSIEELRTLPTRHGIEWRQPGTSHVTFSKRGMTPLTVPAHKPIKPIYVVRFVAMIDDVRSSDDD